MTYHIAEFQQQAGLVWLETAGIATRNADFTTIATALASDTTTMDITLQTPVAALVPGLASHTPVANSLLKVVNRGKGGNLSTSAMVNAIDNVMALGAPPGVIDTPAITSGGSVVSSVVRGAVLTCTQGNWVGVPSTYNYQFKRNGTNFGSNSPTSTYTTVIGDVGFVITCVVSATNASGTGSAPPSNGVTVT